MRYEIEFTNTLRNDLVDSALHQLLRLADWDLSEKPFSIARKPLIKAVHLAFLCALFNDETAFAYLIKLE